jgi:hypothetical protein
MPHRQASESADEATAANDGPRGGTLQRRIEYTAMTQPWPWVRLAAVGFGGSGPDVRPHRRVCKRDCGCRVRTAPAANERRPEANRRSVMCINYFVRKQS